MVIDSPEKKVGVAPVAPRNSPYTYFFDVSH